MVELINHYSSVPLSVSFFSDLHVTILAVEVSFANSFVFGRCSNKNIQRILTELKRKRFVRTSNKAEAEPR